MIKLFSKALSIDMEFGSRLSPMDSIPADV